MQQINCNNCKTPAVSIKSMIDEDTNGAEAKTEVFRAFCPNCGTIFRPTNPNFILAIYNLTNPNETSYTILERGDTFSEVWLMIPTYRGLFSALEGNFSIKILSRVSGVFETDKRKIRYDSVYEEALENPEVYKE